MNAQPQTAAAQAGMALAGMQTAQFENPMGIDGFEFVEFASPEPAALHELFRKLGFVQVARHKSRPIYNYRQNDCTFLINEDPDSFAADFARQHGPSACGFAVRVNKLAEWVRVQALKNGAEPFGAEEALDIGLASHVAAAGELEAITQRVVQALLAKPPEALRQTRELLRHGTREELLGRIELESRAFGQRLRSDEVKAAITAFFASRGS